MEYAGTEELLYCPRCTRSVGEPRVFEMTTYFRQHILAAKSGLTVTAAPPPRSQRAHSQRRRRGDDFNNAQPRDPKDTLIQEADQDPERPVIMTSKLAGVLELIQDWQNAAPEDKIIGEYRDYTAPPLTSVPGTGPLTISARDSFHPVHQHGQAHRPRHTRPAAGGFRLLLRLYERERQGQKHQKLS